jgi:glycosyltransferase involved in cell wall biosynthesis
MKLFVQIPAYNEEATIGQVIADVPRTLPGIASVAILVVDDGSLDQTSEAAVRAGATHVIRHRRNQGLARAFRTGLDACLMRGADVIVNTDADNQYTGRAIADLVRPIVEGRADIVIGDRQTAGLDAVSPGKRLLYRMGNAVARRVSQLDVADASSGFRAFSRAAALKLNVVSTFSYTLETLVQAGSERLALVSVPVPSNPRTRPSRLVRSIPEFVLRSFATMVRTYVMYRPLRVLGTLGAMLVLGGLVPVLRFLILYLEGSGGGHVQSLVLGGALFVVGFLTCLIGVVADLIAFNRRLSEEVLERLRRLEATVASGRGPAAPSA